MKLTRRSAAQATVAVLGISMLITGCVGADNSAGSDNGGDEPSGPLVLQNWRSGPELEALEAVVDQFNERGGLQVEINSVPVETYRVQLPSYLTQQDPPDIYTWLAGNATRAYADDGLLLDLSDVWTDEFAEPIDPALRELSQDSNGNEVFVPMNYYWSAVYYRPSIFEDLGVEPVDTWDDLMALAEDVQNQGVTPFGIGLSDAPWTASRWFDYLNLRINGAEYHLELLAGEHSFADDEVRTVMETWGEAIPYFDQAALGTTRQQSITEFAQGQSAMYLGGSAVQDLVPEDVADDLAFFQFPVVDPAVPVAEEGPTDGLFASANTDQPEAVKEFMEYAGSAEAQETLITTLGGTQLPANSQADVDLPELAQQGQDMLDSADALTQFFNRDGSDALQPTADTALTRHFAGNGELDDILAEWDSAAQQVFENQ